MTLIATYHSEGEGFFALADTLVSLSKPTEGDQNNLPLLCGVGNGFGTHGVRCASKAVLFGNYLVLWSGDLTAARTLINMFKALERPSLHGFRQILDETPHLSQKVRLIYACNIAGKVLHSHWRCKQRTLNGLELVAGGTGDDDFINGSSIRAETQRSSQGIKGGRTWAHLSSKLGELVNLELTSFSHKWDVYGGAYELFVPGVEGGGFKRLSYALTEHSNRLHIEQKWADRPEISRSMQFVGKSDGSLCFLRLFSSENPSQLAIFEIYDILGEGGGDALWITNEEIESLLSFGYVIGSGFIWSYEPGVHYARVFIDAQREEIGITIDPKASNRLIQRYYDSGFGFGPGSSDVDPWLDQEV